MFMFFMSCDIKNNKNNLAINSNPEKQIITEKTDSSQNFSETVKDSIKTTSSISNSITKLPSKSPDSNKNNKFDIYETENYLIVYGDIQHIDIVDKQGNTIVSEEMQQAVSTKKLKKGETYNVYITTKGGKKATQSFTKTF